MNKYLWEQRQIVRESTLGGLQFTNTGGLWVTGGVTVTPDHTRDSRQTDLQVCWGLCCYSSSCICAKLLSCVWLFATPWTVPSSSVHGILQARLLEWAAILSSRASSQTRGPACLLCLRHWRAGPLLLALPGKPIVFHACPQLILTAL